MKNFCLFCLLLGLICPTLAQDDQPPLAIVTSEVHGLYYMLECLIGTPHRSTEMASTYRSRVGNWGPISQAVKRWEECVVRDDFAQMLRSKENNDQQTVSEVLEALAVQSKSLEEFDQRASALIGPEYGAVLSAALLAMQPTYRDYWWQPSRLEQARTKISLQLAQGDFAKSFMRAQKFYRATLPKGEAPSLALIPFHQGILQDQASLNSHHSGVLQVQEIDLGATRHDLLAGTVFHEFLHVLWRAQISKERERWQQAFFSRGLLGRVAYSQLDEGLATALGQGWFQSKVSGETNSEVWDAEPVVDAYGKSLVSVVTPALDAGRPPTSLELTNMVDAFEQSVPDALTSFDVVAAHFTLVTSAQEVHQRLFQNEVMRLGPVRLSEVQSWEDESLNQGPFTVFWVRENERFKLRGRGWTKKETQGWSRYRLRETPRGWELAFIGPSQDLFNKLRELRKSKLHPEHA